jgi:hypothetical protein
MTKRALRLALLVTMLASASWGIAEASPVKSVSGDFTSVAALPPECTSPVGICTRGTLTGDLRATYDFVMLSLVPAGDPTAPTKFVYTGQSVITRLQGGAQIFGVDTGVMDIADPTAAPFMTTVNIAGGTKQYDGAAGQIVAIGVLNLITGDAVGTYTGEIDKHAE